MFFEIVGRIETIETIAVDRAIRDIAGLKRKYGAGNWRKVKGVATIRLADGTFRKAKLHWYQAHGIGKRKIKVKRFLDQR